MESFNKKIAFASMLLFLLFPTAAAAGIKGAKSSPPPSVIVERRLKKKEKIKGPEGRDCKSSAKANEVKFECKSRSGGAAKSSKSKGKSSSSVDELSEEEPESRGISVSSAENAKDKIKYNVRTTNNGIRVKIQYKQEVEENDVETKSETEFEVIFETLVEYVKGDPEDESEAYNWDQDQIIQTVPLREWSDIPGILIDGDVFYFTASTAPSTMNGGITSFNFTVSQANANEKITANSMKIDVKINNFQWSQSDSYLALMSTVESQKKVKVEYDDEATASKGSRSKKTEEITVGFGSDGMESTLGFAAFGEYTWEENAEALTTDDFMDFNSTSSVQVARQGDGITMNETKTTIQVVATSPAEEEEEGRQRIAYSFVGDGAQSASEIYWDPEAGIGYESGAGRHVLLMSFAVSFVGALAKALW